MNTLLRRLNYLLQRARRGGELSEELELHRELLEKEFLDAGRTAEQAAREARRQMGNETLALEDSRDVWSFRVLDGLLQDLRYGVRMAARNGRSTALTIAALGIGIGLNAAVFIAYKAMVARPLDARAPHEMANFVLLRDGGSPQYQFSYPDYTAYRESVESFSGLIAGRFARVALSNAGTAVSEHDSKAQSGFGRLGLIRPGAMNTEFARAHVVSENYFEVLGVKALRGLTFESIEPEELLAQPAVLVSENFWERRFACDSDIVGKIVHLNGVAVRIAGVTPRDFVGTDFAVPAFWIPISIEPLLNADPQWLRDREAARYSLRGRLAADTGFSQAQAEIEAVADRLRELHDPRSDQAQPSTALVWPGSPHGLPVSMLGMDVAALLPLLAALIVLAVACANVASLQLARARSRQTELRARLSLGASRWRLIQQLVTENALLGVAAGSMALLCTWALLKGLAMQAATALPLEHGVLVFDVTPGPGVIAAVFAVALLAGVLAGVVPALDSTRAALAATVRASAGSMRSRRLQNVLVGAQVCLSVVLLIGAGALTNSAVRALKTPPGYDASQVLMLDFQFPERLDYSDARRRAVVHELRTRLAAQPGVAAVSSARAPDAWRFRTAALATEQGVANGATESSGRRRQSLMPFTFVEPNYFETLGIPFLVGRGFGSGGEGSELSVVVSESAADALWPNENPIGRTIRLGPTEERSYAAEEQTPSGATYEVAGVVRDKRVLHIDTLGSTEIYLPLPAAKLAGRPILMRTHSDPAPVREALAPLLASVDPNLQASAVTLEEMLRQAPLFVISCMGAAVASLVGLLGLALALMGIYGTVRYIVVLRTREVGIRMAIGAQDADVVRLILGETFQPVLRGLLLGTACAGGLSFLIHRLVFGVNGFDGSAVVAVSLLFLVVALCASYPSARRATRIDPMVALRSE